MRVLIFILLLSPLSVLAQIGEITGLQGNVTVSRSGDSRSAVLGDPLFVSDTVVTGADGTATIGLQDGSSMDVSADSELMLADYQALVPDAEMNLQRGQLFLRVGDAFSRRANAFRVRTGHGVAGVQGTVFGILTSEASSLFRVREGLVEVVSLITGERRLLRAGETLTVTAAGGLVSGTLGAAPPPDGDAYDPEVFAARAQASELAQKSGLEICPEEGLDLDRLAEESLRPPFPRPGETVSLTGLAVGSGDAGCACVAPDQVALMGLEVGQVLNRNIGDGRAVGGLICRQGSLVPIAVRIQQIDGCIGDEGMDALTEEIIKDLTERGESGVLVSAIKLGTGCACLANRHADQILQAVDSTVAGTDERNLGFSRFHVDQQEAGCRPIEEIENTDERIVDPASPSGPSS